MKGVWKPSKAVDGDMFTCMLLLLPPCLAFHIEVHVILLGLHLPCLLAVQHHEDKDEHFLGIWGYFCGIFQALLSYCWFLFLLSWYLDNYAVLFFVCSMVQSWTSSTSFALLLFGLLFEPASQSQ